MGFPKQQQKVPGLQSAMSPVPDCGEDSYRGSGRLTGKRAVITGGDSGIGRAVAVAYARERADVLIAYSMRTRTLLRSPVWLRTLVADAYSCVVTWPIRLTVER